MTLVIAAESGVILSRSVVRIMLSNPLLNKITKLFGLPKKILSLRLGRGVRAVVIHLISLPAASIKVSHQGGHRRPHGDFQGLESYLVMPRSSDAVAGACNYHLRQLERGVISGGKTPVGRQRLHSGILQVTLNDVPEIVEFLLAGPMRPYSLRLQQVLPCHFDLLSQTVGLREGHVSKSGFHARVAV
jgi:hypothetical protein